MKLIDYWKYNTFNPAMSKYDQYFEIYETFLNKFVGKKVKVLEIGVWQGGSTLMWKKYFGKDATIIGVDILPDCKQFEDDQIKIYIGSQSDINFLNELIEKEGPFDIILDDGGHHMDQQVTSFKYLYKHLNDGGVYLCEDLHTNYWKEFEGGYKQQNTFIEMTKNLIDELHASYSESPDLKITEFTYNTTGIHIFDSVIVFDKTKREKPKGNVIGKIRIKTPLS